MNRISIVLALLIAPAFGPQNSVRRIDLGEAVLVLPEGYRPRDGQADLIIHMHGAAPAVEKALTESGWQGPLLLFNRKGLSSVYTEPFRDPSLFPRLLEKARTEIAKAWPADDPKIGRVFVSSFSAGFGGVREMLAVPEHFARIDGVILADSLYAGYLGDVAKRQIDPAKMANFRKFAAEAAAGRKTMVVTHSALIPDGYASTGETADDLIGHVGGKADDIDENWGEGWRLKRRFSTGRFLVLGFAGVGGEDHMRHLRQLGKIWRAGIDVDRKAPPELRSNLSPVSRKEITREMLGIAMITPFAFACIHQCVKPSTSGLPRVRQASPRGPESRTTIRATLRILP